MISVKNRFLIRNARIFTPISSRDFAAKWQTVTFDPGAILVSDGQIEAVGEENELSHSLAQNEIVQIDAGGNLLTPGFVDCHTHPVFHNHRAHEFEMRVQGASYVEISKAGGGIRFSVRDLRNASKQALLKSLLARLDVFLAHGTTTIEAKSGYGLTLEDEIKSLEVLKKANDLHPVDIVPTFLGAHEIPDEYQHHRQAYIDLIINEMLPRVAKQHLATFMDVFCEEHVFSAQEAKRLLEAGRKFGLLPKIHADQLTNNGGAALAATVGAISADHLENTPPAVDEQLLRANVVPVMLPGADFFLSASKYGPARRMIEVGLPVALATDFNPGTCMCENMQMMLTLAALQLKMLPAEAFTAATLHAARAIGSQHRIGSLEKGKQADFVIWQAHSIAELPYHFGINLVEQVYKNGKRVYPARRQ